MKKTTFNLALALILSSYCISSYSGCLASDTLARSTRAQPADEPAHKEMVKSTKALRRLDFRIKGRSCVLCLLDIQRRMRHERGTVKTVVQLRVPYGAVVIYDSSVTSKDKLFKAAKGNKAEEMGVSFLDITDQSITKLPVVLVPLQTSLPVAVQVHH